MNRLSWDSTAPRRLGRKRGDTAAGSDDSLDRSAEAELIRPTMATDPPRLAVRLSRLHQSPALARALQTTRASAASEASIPSSAPSSGSSCSTDTTPS